MLDTFSFSSWPFAWVFGYSTHGMTTSTTARYPLLIKGGISTNSPRILSLFIFAPLLFLPLFPLGEDPGDTTFLNNDLPDPTEELKDLFDDYLKKIPETIFDYILEKLTSLFDWITTAITTAHETITDIFLGLIIPVADDIGVSQGIQAQIGGAIHIIMVIFFFLTGLLAVRIYRLILDIAPII